MNSIFSKFFKMLNNKCRNNLYPKSDLKRSAVSDEKVLWETKWSEYTPVKYTSAHILKADYADPFIDNDPNQALNKIDFDKNRSYNIAFTNNIEPNWNSKDTNINRISYMGIYDVINGIPINPIGRTGLIGRGNLGKWGPNHAADIIVTKWVSRDYENEHTLFDTLSNLRTQLNLCSDTLVKDAGCGENYDPYTFQFIAIKRKGDGLWAFPGGFVDKGEDPVYNTAPREFAEEVLNMETLKLRESKRDQLLGTLHELFTDFGTQIYRGYVDDPRNTDNAWMETVAINVHLGGKPGEKVPDPEKYKILKDFPVKGGDDATDCKWINVTRSNGSVLRNLYASHYDILKIVMDKHKVDIS